MPHTFDFVVYLPNRTSVEVQVPMEVCRNLTVQGFVKLVKIELARRCDTKVKQRAIVWGKHVKVRDFQGRPVLDGEFASSSESKAGKVLLLYVSWSFACKRVFLFTLNRNSTWRKSLCLLSTRFRRFVTLFCRITGICRICTRIRYMLI